MSPYDRTQQRRLFRLTGVLPVGSWYPVPDNDWVATPLYMAAGGDRNQQEERRDILVDDGTSTNQRLAVNKRPIGDLNAAIQDFTFFNRQDETNQPT